MKTSSVKKIYFYCPPQNATGGTELAHQGASELIKLGYRAYMFYSYECSNPTADRFKKYNVPYTFDVNDKPENLIIIPEIALGISKSFENAHLIAWWMSVDNFFYDCSLIDALKNRYWSTVFKYPKRQLFYRNIKSSNRRIHLTDLNKRFDKHFYQSEYANYFLKRNGIKKKEKLSDFINDEFVNNIENISKDRKKRILYNPAKGINITKRFIELLPEIEIIPLSGLPVTKLKSLYLTSMIYIDFGNHPGKDRMLREASVNGCIVITGKKGSAAFHEDVSIDSMFKFGNSNSEINKACQLIHKILLNYERYLDKQLHYRNLINKEKHIFICDLKKCFASYSNAISD